MFAPVAVYASKAEHKIKLKKKKKKKATFPKKYSIYVYEANSLLGLQNSLLIPLTFVSNVNRSEQAFPDYAQWHTWTPPARSKQGSLLMQIAALSLSASPHLLSSCVFLEKGGPHHHPAVCLQDQTFPATQMILPPNLQTSGWKLKHLLLWWDRPFFFFFGLTNTELQQI